MTDRTVYCACLGCMQPATTLVLHDEYGQRAVCDTHTRDQEVLADV